MKGCWMGLRKMREWGRAEGAAGTACTWTWTGRVCWHDCHEESLAKRTAKDGTTQRDPSAEEHC